MRISAATENTDVCAEAVCPEWKSRTGFRVPGRIRHSNCKKEAESLLSNLFLSSNALRVWQFPFRVNLQPEPPPCILERRIAAGFPNVASGKLFFKNRRPPASPLPAGISKRLREAELFERMTMTGIFFGAEPGSPGGRARRIHVRHLWLGG